MEDFLDITQPHIVQRIIADIESNQNKERKEEDFKSYRIMTGDQRSYVKEILAEMFPESHHVMTPSNINVLKKVVDRIGNVYKDAPTRLVNGEKNELLDEIYKEGHFDRSYSAMDKTFNRSKCFLNWVQNVPNMPTKFRLVPLSQYVFDVVIDNDTLELLMVVLSYPSTEITDSGYNNDSDGLNQIIAESGRDSSASTKQYAIWTKKHHVNIKSTSINKTTTIDYMAKVDENGERVMDMENKLGVIPFVWGTTEPDLPEFPTPNPLADESVTINVMNSTLLSAATRQIGMLVMKYPQGSRVQTVHTGLSVALQLPQSTETDPRIETTADYIVPNSDLAGMRETFLEYAAGVLADNGLEGSTLSGEDAKFTSGLERLIASASITDKRSENIQTYRSTEKQVFDIIKAYDQANNTRLFNPADELNVIFPEPKIVTTEKEKLEVIEKKDSLGLLEEKDKFEIAYPDMSEKEIEAKMERIKQAKDEMMSTFLPEPSPVKEANGDIQ